MSGPVEVRRLSTPNDEFQVLTSLLTNRQKRHQRGEFIVQGVKAINAAVDTGWPIRAFVVADGRRLSRWASDMLQSVPVAVHYLVAPDLMMLLSQKDEPVELLAVGVARERTLDEVPIHATMTVCVCDRLQSPGNLGSIVRSADAFRADGVVLTGRAADPFDPQVVRGSTGSLFSIPVVAVDAPAALAPWLATVRKTVPIRVVGTDEEGAPLREGDLRRPVAIVLGAEASGLSKAARALCDEIVALPMGGVATSLNVASAAAIFLHAATTSR